MPDLLRAAAVGGGALGAHGHALQGDDAMNDLIVFITLINQSFYLEGRDRLRVAEEDGGGAGAAGSHAERSLLAAGRHGNRHAGTPIHLNSGNGF